MPYVQRGGTDNVIVGVFVRPQPGTAEEYLADNDSELVAFLNPSKISLSTNATDSVSPFDGIPDISADGVATASIDLQKKDKDDNDMTSAGDNDTIHLSTDGGSLSTISINFVNGAASVTLTSSTETKCATIRAWDPNGKLVEDTIQIQFRP